MVCLSSPCAFLSSVVVCLAQWRFVHFHGQQTTRQDRHKSIYKDRCRKHTILFRFILSPLFFFFPDAHLRELEKLWTDDIIVEALWREFMQKLVSEWTDFVLYVSPGFPFQRTPRVLTLVNATVNSDACSKCRVSSYPRCHCLPSIPTLCEPMDQALSCSDYKFDLVGV
jgi:hypothetical protein